MWWSSSPNDRHRVFGDFRVGCGQLQSLAEGMGDQDAVEWVAVNGGEFLEVPDIFVQQALIFDSVSRQAIPDDFAWRARQGQLAKVVFDLDFPTRCLVKNQSVGSIFKERADFPAQHCDVVNQPKEGACIEENVHFLRSGATGEAANNASISRSLPKKSPPTGHWPLS